MPPSTICTTISAVTTQKYFARRLHRRRRLERAQWVPVGNDGRSFLAVRRDVVPGERADAGEQAEDADERPQVRRGRRHVADQRLRRPVARVGDRIVGAVRRGRPRRPEEERHHRLALLDVRNRVLLDRVLRTQRVQLDVWTEQPHVVVVDLPDRVRAILVHRDHARGRIVGVLAHRLLEPRLQARLLHGIEVRIGLAAVTLRPEFEQSCGFAVQPVRRPVRCYVATVTPDGTHLVAADALPDLPARVVLFLRKQRLPSRGLYGRGNRWRRDVDLASEVQEDAKRHHHQGRQHLPQSTRVRHCKLPAAVRPLLGCNGVLRASGVSLTEVKRGLFER